MNVVTPTTEQVYELRVRATPEQVWDAITKPEVTSRYYGGTSVENTHDRHRAWENGVLSHESPTLVWEPSRRLVHGWCSLCDPERAAEEESRVTWEIEPLADGTTKLTVTHDRLESSPLTAANVSAGWPVVLEGLKRLLDA